MQQKPYKPMLNKPCQQMIKSTIKINNNAIILFASIFVSYLIKFISHFYYGN